MIGKGIELLSPAGNAEKGRAALRYGADAVYLAGGSFGMRAAADNFTADGIADMVRYAHSLGKKVYVTVNTMPRWNEYDALTAYIRDLADISPDALIIADLGVFMLAKKLAPNIPLHVSTQAGAVSHADCAAWGELGARRVVLARELSLADISAIRRFLDPSVELEAFVHGSMCVSYSGRCLLSANLTGRDANRGECTQPCRWNYRLFESETQDPTRFYELDEQKRPGRRIPVVETDGGTFIMSSKDLCMIDHIPELAATGITSLKIEGRMKSAYYAAVTAGTYRAALDGTGKPEDLRRELDGVSHRVYGTGFFFDSPDENAQLCPAGQSGYIGERTFLASVLSYDPQTRRTVFIQRNKLTRGDEVSLLSPGMNSVVFTADDLRDADGLPIESTPHPGMKFSLPLPCHAEEGDILRK